jgi:hypothetical protein
MLMLQAQAGVHLVAVGAVDAAIPLLPAQHCKLCLHISRQQQHVLQQWVSCVVDCVVFVLNQQSWQGCCSLWWRWWTPLLRDRWHSIVSVA